MAPASNPRGRPRSEEARTAILSAAARLLASKPVRAIAIEEVAREAGRQKPLIYRHWPSKTALLVEAFVQDTDKNVRFERLDKAAETLRDQMRRVARVMGGEQGRIASELMAEAASDPEAQALVRDKLIEPRRAWVRDVIAWGQERGEFRDALDVEALIDALYAPFYYRPLVGHAAISRDFADALIDTVTGGILSSTEVRS